MSCPTPQINSQCHFLPQWIAAANASVNTLPPERAIPAKWAPLASASKPKDLRSHKNLVYPSCLTKGSFRYQNCKPGSVGADASSSPCCRMAVHGSRNSTGFEVQISTELGSKTPPVALQIILSSECIFGHELA